MKKVESIFAVIESAKTNSVSCCERVRGGTGIAGEGQGSFSSAMCDGPQSSSKRWKAGQGSSSLEELVHELQLVVLGHLRVRLAADDLHLAWVDRLEHRVTVLFARLLRSQQHVRSLEHCFYEHTSTKCIRVI